MLQRHFNVCTLGKKMLILFSFFHTFRVNVHHHLVLLYMQMRHQARLKSLIICDVENITLFPFLVLLRCVSGSFNKSLFMFLFISDKSEGRKKVWEKGQVLSFNYL